MNFIRGYSSIIVFLLIVAGFHRTHGDKDVLAHDEEWFRTISDYRLSIAVIPMTYEILLMPKMQDDFTFEGIVRIDALVQRATNSVILHHGNINITWTTVTSNDRKIEIFSTTYNATTEKYEIRLRETLPTASRITLNLEYKGVLRDDMIGFYKSSYVDSAGKIRWMASTQFQTAHARHAFPCFDEPSFKAKFIIRILRPKNYACLSNMPLRTSVPVTEGYWDEFEKSIPMSTYLVAFTVSEFANVHTGNFSVWARPTAVSQAKYALHVGPRALDMLSNTFKQKYQISKMDMVAVPDFDAGAMENWGLVTYRESRLLRDDETTSDAATQSIASVIVHELTHMWFGNMITPEWWSYLWLSEAFARYYQYFGTAQLEKSWNMDEQFVVEQHQTGFAADGIESSKPMSRDIANSQQLKTIGDTITYNKGGSIVRMMNLIFGSDVFNAGLQNYLQNNRVDKLGRPEYLWKEFQNEIDRRKTPLKATVKDIMSTWTTQAGFPVLNVNVEQDGTVVLQQKRFLLRNLKDTPTNLTWWIPVSWTTEDNPNFHAVEPKYWLSEDHATINVGKTSGWVIFNVQSSGFYRVNYDNGSWYRILDTLNSEKYRVIHVLNRAALVDDALNLARADLLPYNVALTCLQYLTSETNYLPFKSAFSGLTYLDQRFSGHAEYYSQFKKFVLMLTQNAYEELGYLDRPSDDRLTVLLRAELNKWACHYDHEGCVQTFTTMFRQWRKDNTSTIKPNQRPVAYCMGVKHGTKDDWEFLWNQYFNSNSANEQLTIIQALGCTTDTTILKKYLLSALEGFEKSRIRRQDCATVFSAVYGSGIVGAEFVLNFIDEYHAQMKEYNNGLSLVSSVLSSASQHFSTLRLVDQFESLIEKHKSQFDSILNSLRNSLQIARYELRWFQNHGDSIVSWINSFNEKNSPADDPKGSKDYLLPQTLSPERYRVWVSTNVAEADDFTFTGSVTIDTVVSKKTKTIVLHSADLSHEKVLVVANGDGVVVTNVTTDKKYDFLKIELARELQVNESVIIMVSFKGQLNEDMRGFYRSWYINDEGEKRWLAATHMEPVAARKMFPCFDEPAMKARFTMSVTLPENYTAISNMPVQNSTSHKNGLKTVLFEETPKMSTYLVALVVSDFVSAHSGRFGIWSRKNVFLQTSHALMSMKPLVEYYEQALALPYQLPKLDMVALPDFVSGAMENWGLLTYKERNLLYDKTRSTTASKQSITNVISHEITHQWFGDLVSPLWWKYVWLNEGFARYFQYHGTAQVEKDWALESQFVVEQLHSALEVDSSPTSHAMTHDVYTPTEIRSIFDTISYGKGASVIRMMEKTFGRDVFFSALHNYLKKREYDVATPEDLFDAFKDQITDSETKSSFHDIMNTWTTQPGYPVVHATLQPGRLLLKQERFLLKPATDTTLANTWYIPITWTSLNASNFEQTKPRHWIKNTTEDTVVLPNNDLILLNLQQSGFYRTNYDDQTWKRIIDFLKSDQRETIHEINRATLIDDLMSLGRAELVDYDIVLSATQYLTKESSYLPWRAFFNGLNYLNKQFHGRDAFGAFKQYVSSLLTPIYEKLGFEDKETDTHVTILFRSHVRKWACKFNVSDCEKKALEHFRSPDGTYKKIPPNYLSATYCTVASKNDPLDWHMLWDFYQQETFVGTKSILLQSLACATDKFLIEELLQQAISKYSGIRFEDSSGVFSSVMDASPEGVDCAIDFVKDNYEKMISYYKQVSSVRSIVDSIGKKVFTEKLFNKYVDLLEWLSKKDKTARNILNSYKKGPAYELKWARKHVPRLHEWFETHYPHKNYRLPTIFTPTRYHVSLSPRFEEMNFTFTGRVQIEMNRETNEVSRIVVNAYKLNIERVLVHRGDANTIDETLEVSTVLVNETTQTLTIFMKNFIQSEKLIVDIQFAGKLNDDLEGFYRSYYVSPTGEIRWLATTQFEPTYAREAFPCFDEPAFKARFVISLERPDTYVALSNMPRSTTVASNVTGRAWDTFDETEVMSSYLIAFVVCDFKTVRNHSDFVNVWGRAEVAPYGELAEMAGLRMLEYLYTETGHKYSFPKMDLIGIPDFSMGAMENWGLVTFREYGLFYDKDVISAKYTDYIITIIAHELSHMMFGNLVTCHWWEYIWLNEGFAEFMQWRLSHLFRPEYGYNELFVVDELHPALLNDASSTTHPMNHPVSKPSDISKIFDTVAYGKSSSVIRMIQKSLDPRVFPNATYQYLLHHSHKTATPKDLWKFFDDEVNRTRSLGDWDMSMETLMDGWTNKPGYPVVSAVVKGSHVTLTQKRFSTYAESNDFWIPITMATASEPNFTTTWTNIWLGGEPLDLYLKKPNEWFIINVQQAGYYRVNYDAQSWSRLIEALSTSDHSGIHVTNRAQIIDDLLNLARTDHVKYNTALDATMYLKTEEHYIPWRAFFNGLSFIDQRYTGQEDHALLKTFVTLLASNVYDKLGFVDSTEEIHFAQLHRELILAWLCKYDHDGCVQTARNLFDEWRQYLTNRISPNTKSAVYCTAIRHGSSDDWYFLWQEYRKTNFAAEKKIILDALGCTKDRRLLVTYIEYAFTRNYTADIRKQDVSAALASVYSNSRLGADEMLEYFMGHYEQVYEYYGNWDSVGELMSKLASRLSTSTQISKLERFIKTKGNNLMNILPTLKSAAETATNNYQWYSKHSIEIDVWLNKSIAFLQGKNSSGRITAHALSVFFTTVFSIFMYILNH